MNIIIYRYFMPSLCGQIQLLRMAIEIKKTIYHQSGALYGLGFIGAIIYFIGHATGFWMGVLGVLKAIVWPAILVYKLLEVLKM